MKTFSSLAFLAAVALALFDVRLEVFVSVLFALGFGAIVALDYGRTPRPLRVPTATRARRQQSVRFRAPALTEPNRLAA